VLFQPPRGQQDPRNEVLSEDSEDGSVLKVAKGRHGSKLLIEFGDDVVVPMRVFGGREGMTV
jgi:hypothetical protein